MNLTSQNELYSENTDAIYFGFVFDITSNLTDNGSQHLKAAVRKLSTGQLYIYREYFNL